MKAKKQTNLCYTVLKDLPQYYPLNRLLALLVFDLQINYIFTVFYFVFKMYFHSIFALTSKI